MKNTILVLILALILSSCAPVTRYRREALVPSPQPPPFRGETVGKGHMEFQAQVAGSHVEEDPLPDIHDPALWVPEFMLNAAGMFGLASFIDLGFLFSYAHGSWANDTAHGTPPMPSGAGENVFAIGPQLGIGGKGLGGKIFGGGYLSLQYVRIPWSQWELVGGGPGDALYELRDTGGDNDIYYRVGLYFGGRPLAWLALNIGLVLHASWLNDGFSDTESSGSTLKHGMPLIMPLIGARFDIKPIFIETTLTFPISAEREIEYFPIGWSAGLGVRI